MERLVTGDCTSNFEQSLVYQRASVSNDIKYPNPKVLATSRHRNLRIGGESMETIPSSRLGRERKLDCCPQSPDAGNIDSHERYARSPPERFSGEL